MQSTYLNYALRQLEAIVNIPSPSGFTAEAVRYCSNEFANMGYTPEITPKGGLLVCLGGEGEGLLLGAHIDTLGAMVREVKANGALRAVSYTHLMRKVAVAVFSSNGTICTIGVMAMPES